MSYAYLVATLALGAVLYSRRPGLYIGFTWWLWFLTPEVRRLLDYAQGWNPVNPVMLAPYLVTALAGFTLVYHLPKLQLKRYFPFVLVFLGVLYAYFVGVYRMGVSSATFQLIEWLVPVTFAFYLVVHWRRYPAYSRAVWRTFVWGVAVMGAYGLVQFFFLPPWDRYWMLSAQISSTGPAEPLELRVFSTLNSQTPFADVMMAGLLLLLGGGSLFGIWRWSAAAAGYASFILSMVRQAWGGWLVGLLYIIVQGGRSGPGSLLKLMVAALMILPLLTVGPVADKLNERVETTTALSQDRSFEARLDFYAEAVPQALFNPVGAGLGSTGVGTKLSADEVYSAAFDSGLLEMPFLLGWPGTLLYVGGLAWLLYYAFHGRKPTDFFAVASRAIVVGTLVQLPFNDKTDGVPGMLLWSFLGLAIAADVYRGYVSSRNDKSGATHEGDNRGWQVGLHDSKDRVHEGVAASKLPRKPGGLYR